MSKFACFSNTVGIIRIIAKIEPAYFLWSAPQIIINSVLPLLYVYAPKLIIEKLTSHEPYGNVAAAVLTYCGILLILNVLLKFLQGKSSFSAENFGRKLRFDIGRTVSGLSLRNVESSSNKEICNIAANAASLTSAMQLLERLTANLISIIGLAAIAVRLDIIFLVTVAFVLAVKVTFTCIRFKTDKKMQVLYNKNQITGNYLEGLAYFNPGAEKELRVNSLQNWFMGKIKQYRGEMLRLQYRDFRRYAVFEGIMSLIVAFQSLIVLIVLSERYLGNAISIADLTMYFSTVTSLSSALSILTEQIRSAGNQLLNYSHLERLLKIKTDENNGVTGKSAEVPQSKEIEIVFDDVSFSYGEKR